MSGAYVTSGITFDSYVRSLHGGLAFRVLKDDAGRGTLSSTTVAGAYNFRTKIAQGWYMNLALEAAYFQRNLDWDKLSFRDMIDPNQGFIFTTQDIYREGFVKGGDLPSWGSFSFKTMVDWICRRPFERAKRKRCRGHECKHHPCQTYFAHRRIIFQSQKVRI